MALKLHRFKKQVRGLERLLKEFPKHPAAKEVHDLRNRISVIEAVAFAVPEQGGDSLASVLLPLLQIRKAAGKVRDTDRHLALACSLPKTLDPDCAADFRKHLQHRRKRASARLHRAVTGCDWRRGLRRCFREMVEVPELSVSGDLPIGSVGTAEMARNFLIESGISQEADSEAIHSYRIQVRRFWHLLRLSTEQMPELTDSLGSIKTAIGVWHDWLAMERVAEHAIKHQSCPVIGYIRQKTAASLCEAVQQVEQVRKQMLVGEAESENMAPKIPVKSVGKQRPVALGLAG